MSIFTTRYHRAFPPGCGAGGDTGEYIRPCEVEDDDEQALIDEAVRGIVSDARSHARGVGKRDPDFHEAHWGHTTGVLRGELRIDAIDALPEALRVGIFGEERTYRIIARPHFVQDFNAKLAAGRMALKLEYPSDVPNVYAPSGSAKELDLLFAEGDSRTNDATHAFFFRDARQLLLVVNAFKPSFGTLLDARNWTLLGRTLKALQPAQRLFGIANRRGWAGKPYFSLGPFRLGDGAMKLCLLPQQEHTIEPQEMKTAARGHRSALEAWIAAGKDASFDLCVQVATPDCIPGAGPNGPPKDVMVAEYCDLVWDEEASPYRRVGTVVFPAAQRELVDAHPWSPFQFNAWNTLEEMRPLGQLFRIRRHVHKAHCEARLEHVYEATPGETVDEAPFAPGAPKA
jgi:hypothetical protein